MDGFTEDRFGMGLGHFFDFHAACGAGHEDDLARGAVDEDAEVELTLDIESFFNEQALDDTACGTSLHGDEIHAEHVAGDFGGLVGGVGELDATGFPAAAGVDLGFDDNDGGVQPLGGFACFFLGEGDFSAGCGDAIARQDRFGLVLVDLHLSVGSVWPKESGQPMLEFVQLQNTEVYFGKARRSNEAEKQRDTEP